MRTRPSFGQIKHTMNVVATTYFPLNELHEFLFTTHFRNGTINPSQVRRLFAALYAPVLVRCWYHCSHCMYMRATPLSPPALPRSCAVLQRASNTIFFRFHIRHQIKRPLSLHGAVPSVVATLTPLPRPIVLAY